MGQVKSIEYPFYDQVMDTIEELKSTGDENNSQGWQMLIHEICRHRGQYIQDDCDVTDIDKLLYLVARECSGLLSNQEVSIPCLKVRWVKNVQAPPRCVIDEVAQQLLKLSITYQAYLSDKETHPEKWEEVMKGLARVLNKGFAQCTSDTDKQLMKHIFMEQFKTCPLHSAKVAFL